MKAKVLASHIERLEARIAPAFAAVVDLGSLNGRNGFKIQGEAYYDISGYSVSDAGDVNGDGLDDVIIGASKANANGEYSGASYVVFGHGGGFGAKLNLSTLNGSNGFKISGEAEGDYSGRSVSGASDVNGDGFDDLIIGAYRSATNGSFSGASYVVYGHVGNFDAELNLADLDGSNGTKIPGESAGGFAGNVSGAGDVNGDGFDDLIVGAPLAGEDVVGASYVIFGRAEGLGATLDLTTLDGTNGCKITGETSSDEAGISVSSAGDMNGDGFDDVLIGAFTAEANGDRRGAAYVVFGHAGAFDATLSLADLDGSNGFRMRGETLGSYTGRRVSDAGDVNGDGFDDIIIGAPRIVAHDYYSGAAYVVFGHNGSFDAKLDLSTLNGSNGFKISGEGPEDSAGLGVSGAGDVNGDGFDDLIVGAPGSSFGREYAGVSYLILGHTGGFDATVEPASLNGRNGCRILGETAHDGSGISVSSAGDVNGDGFADLIIGAAGADPNGSHSGASYVLFGSGFLSLSSNGRIAHFTEPDGDLVTVKTSKKAFSLGDFTFHPSTGGPVLDRIDLTGHGSAFAKADLTIKATPQRVNGMLVGDGRVNIGELDASGINLGKVKIGGDVTVFRAGNGSGVGVKLLQAASLGLNQDLFPALTAGLEVTGGIGQLKVGGSVSDFAIKIGVGDGHGLGNVKIGGSLTDSILAVGGKIGALNVGGSMVDSTVRAPGTLLPARANAAVAIGSLHVSGDVQGSDILAGYDAGGNAVNGDAGIGAVVIEGGFSASNLVAGIADATHDGFGQNDSVIAGGNADIVASIASITIKGLATGSVAAGDFFGITAERVKKAKIHGTALVLGVDKDDLLLDTGNQDLRLIEV